MAMTVFIRTEMKVDLLHANYLMGCMYYAIVRLMTNGVAELSLTIIRLPVVHKQRSFYLYPAWAYSIPASILKIPLSLADALIWTSLTYYVIGYSPEISRLAILILVLQDRQPFYCLQFATDLDSANEFQVFLPVPSPLCSASILNILLSFCSNNFPKYGFCNNHWYFDFDANVPVWRLHHSKM